MVPAPGPNSSLMARDPGLASDSTTSTCRPEQGEIFSTPLPSPLRQDHVFARHNKFGSFQVKIEQKTETRTKTNTTKTKQKNDTKTEQKTMVADNVPTAGQRAVHFRILAIIGVAAACGLSVPASGPRTSLHALYACAPAPCNSVVFGP